MKTFVWLLVSIFVAACGSERETESRAPVEEDLLPPENARPETAEEAEVRETPPAVGVPEGFNRAMLGGYISVGDPSVAFTPLAGSAFTSDGPRTRMTLVAQTGWRATLLVPNGPPDGATDEAQNRYAADTLDLRVTDGEGDEHRVDGHVVITALEPSTGRVSFTAAGVSATDASLEVVVEADTRIGPVSP